MSERPKLTLAEDEHIAAVVPEYVAGPGWSNAPLWVHVVKRGGGHRVHCIQPTEQTPTMQVLFGVCEKAHSAMLAEVERSATKQKEKQV